MKTENRKRKKKKEKRKKKKEKRKRKRKKKINYLSKKRRDIFKKGKRKKNPSRDLNPCLARSLNAILDRSATLHIIATNSL
jgi:hypothetical protein